MFPEVENFSFNWYYYNLTVLINSLLNLYSAYYYESKWRLWNFATSTAVEFVGQPFLKHFFEYFLTIFDRIFKVNAHQSIASEKPWKKTPYINIHKNSVTELERIKLTLNKFPMLFLYERYNHNYLQPEKNSYILTWNLSVVISLRLQLIVTLIWS